MHHFDGAAGETERHGPQRGLACPIGDLVESGQGILHDALLGLLARKRHLFPLAGEAGVGVGRHRGGIFLRGCREGGDGLEGDNARGRGRCASVSARAGSNIVICSHECRYIYVYMGIYMGIDVVARAGCWSQTSHSRCGYPSRRRQHLSSAPMDRMSDHTGMAWDEVVGWSGEGRREGSRECSRSSDN